jgi:dephospho-CoA kinase
MAKYIIGIAGEMASGKDTVTNYLVEQYGAVQYRFSDPLRSILGILHKEITRDNLTALSTHLRTAFGQDLLAHVIEREAEKNPNELVVIDGVRRISDIDLVQGKDNFFLVYVDADVHVRYKRLHKRGQNEDDATLSFEEFLEDHGNETERFIPELKNVAQEVIFNEGSLAELHSEVDTVMAKYGISKKI